MKVNFFKPLTLAIGCAALFGCGDDDPAGGPDAAKPDSKTPDAPDGPFVEAPIGLNAPDGGEIRIENLIFPDGISRTLTTAYFVKSQAGDPTPQPFPNVVDNDVLNCNTFEDHIYPFGDASETVGAPATYGVDREYMDVGDKITLQDKDGATPAFELVGYQNFVTPFLGGSFHEFTYNPDTAAGDPFLAVPAVRMGGTGANPDGHKLKVTIPGGPDLGEERVLDFTGDFKGIEIPPRPVVSDFSTLGNPSEMDIRRSVPFTRSWTLPAQAPADLLSFVAVFNTVGGVYLTKLCVTAKPGKITMTPEDLATMPSEGIMFIAHLLHRTRTFDNVRRIDMVGTACTATYFTMVP